MNVSQNLKQNPMQRLTLLTLLLLPFLFFACQEDDSNGTQPGEDLVVSFNNLNHGEQVRDSITVSVDASPQESVSEVSLTFAGEQVNNYRK